MEGCSPMSLIILPTFSVLVSVLVSMLVSVLVSMLVSVLVSVLASLFRYIFTLKSPSKSINSGFGNPYSSQAANNLGIPVPHFFYKLYIIPILCNLNYPNFGGFIAWTVYPFWFSAIYRIND